MSEVDRIHDELLALKEIILKAESPSDLNAFETLAANTLLLSSASYFERQICEGIEQAARSGGTSEALIQFILKHGLERKYHQLFNWKQNNINGFLGLFGDDAKKTMDDEIRADESLTQATKDFMSIGSQRNELVHNNFASFALVSDMAEIWTKYLSAKRFSDWLPLKLSEFTESKVGRDDRSAQES